MKGLLSLVFAALLVGARAASTPKKSIAIVGSGISGSSAAFFIKELFDDDAEIHIFEKNDYAGGRMKSTQFGPDTAVELGASVIHRKNEYMASFATRLNLRSKVRLYEGNMGIWDGGKFVFYETGWRVWDFLNLWWRYGNALYRMNSFTSTVVDKFCSIYELQRAGVAYDSVPAILNAMGLYDLTQQTLSQILYNPEGPVQASALLIRELATGISRVNYGQSASITGLAGLVSLAASSSDLWAVEGGNAQVAAGLLQLSNAQVFYNTSVLSIRKAPATSAGSQSAPMGQADPSSPCGRAGGDDASAHDDGAMYEVTYESSSGDEGTPPVVCTREYDAVIIATPLELANIDVEVSVNATTSRKYQRTVTTLVRGRVSPKFFHTKDDAGSLPDFVMTMETEKAFFNSLGKLASTPATNRTHASHSQTSDGPAPESLYKVFSRAPLTREQLDLLFDTYSDTRVEDWWAYPHYQPPQEFPPIVLDKRVFYVNAIESAASAMEGERECCCIFQRFDVGLL
eukprot:jgi/Mesvir1/13427/Mv16504-RA.5